MSSDAIVSIVSSICIAAVGILTAIISCECSRRIARADRLFSAKAKAYSEFLTEAFTCINHPGSREDLTKTAMCAQLYSGPELCDAIRRSSSSLSSGVPDDKLREVTSDLAAVFDLMQKDLDKLN